MTYKIFIGWDPREAEAAEVCKHSILKHASAPVEIVFLKQSELRAQQVYTRQIDADSSTEFTFTRFLVPHLCQYQGHALFVDCDFLFEHDVVELFQQYQNPKHSVSVVQHDNYAPKSSIKMDGKVQHQYPKKNWSSLMLFNCEHAESQTLTVHVVNTQTAQFLHRFDWSTTVGSIDKSWNWLVNWYHEPEDGKPKAIHSTEGGPWFPDHVKTEYGAQWTHALREYKGQDTPPPPPPPPPHVFDQVPAEITALFKDILKYRVDPAGEIYAVSLNNLIDQLKMLDNQAVVAIGTKEADNKFERKGLMFDPYLQSFTLGSGGQISQWEKHRKSTTPVVFRGVTKRKEMEICYQEQRDFYYIDTGYFGNGRKKIYHRITKNALQNLGPIIDRPGDRFETTGVQLRKFRPGTNILLAPPSQKLLNIFNIDLEEWITTTQEQIKQHTDRPIVIRTKQGRAARVNDNTMEMALSQDVHCLVTFSSIAAGEALLLGKPAITLGPNAAAALCSNSVSEIESLKIPTLDQVHAWARHMAYCQFSEAEMRDGTAWRILNEKP